MWVECYNGKWFRNCGWAMKEIFSNYSATIAELQNDPRAIWKHDEPVAIFDRDEPIGYCIPKDLYVRIINALEDAHWVKVIEDRKNDQEIEVAWDAL